MKNLIIKLSFFAIFFIMTLISFSQSQIIECGNGEMEYDPVPEAGCDNSSFPWVCIRLKFHFINNTGSSMNRPTDQEYAILLNELNTLFTAVKFHFTIDQSCIDEHTNSNLTKITDLYDYVIGQNLVDPTSINIFTTQVKLNNNQGSMRGEAAYLYHYLYSIADASIIAHEMGHMFALIHTHGPINDGLLAENLWECKNGLNSKTMGDKITDTPADPYAMDVDHDTHVDHDKWVSNCVQTTYLLNTYVGGCQTDLTQWKIPINNVMSYYDCKQEFTPCQINAMRNDLIANHDHTKDGIILDCADDPYNLEIVCKDITIDHDVELYNATIPLCKNQKIIITTNGSYTLHNCLLTKKTQNNTNCPNFIFDIGNWDGIYMTGGNAHSVPPPPGGGPSLSPHGFLKVLDGSIIEYSNNGIQASTGNGGIFIDASVMRDNLKLMDIKAQGQKDFSSFEPVGSVAVRNGSLLSVPSNGASTQIQIEGTSIWMDNSILSKDAGGTITGIKSMAGAVIIRNSSLIQNFDIAVDKETDGTYKQGVNGLRIYDSRILNCATAIRNRCKYASIRHNYIDGIVDQENDSYGFWHSNNFRKKVDIKAPTTTQQFEENKFYQSTLNIDGNQKLTNAICNTWEDQVNCVKGINIGTIKESWGTQFLSSGNKHTSTNSIFDVADCNQITNWHGSGNTVFTYNSQFFGKVSNLDKTCNYNLAPSINGDTPNEESEYNNATNNSNWVTYDSIRQVMSTALPYLSDSLAKIMRTRIADAKVSMELLVLNAMQHADSLMGNESFNTWLSRANPKTAELNRIQYHWHNQYFDSLTTYLITISPVDSSEAVDKAILISASEYLGSLHADSIDIYHLPDTTLDYLVDLASVSFEDYTNILRAFLSMYYDLYIDHEYLEAYSRKEGNVGIISNKEPRFLVYPNPTEDCLNIYSSDNYKHNLKLEFYSIDGKRFNSFKCETQEMICLKNIGSNTILLLKIEDVISHEKEYIRLILSKS